MLYTLAIKLKKKNACEKLTKYNCPIVHGMARVTDGRSPPEPAENVGCLNKFGQITYKYFTASQILGGIFLFLGANFYSQFVPVIRSIFLRLTYNESLINTDKKCFINKYIMISWIISF